MRNVCKAWNAIHTDVCHANPLLSVKIAPKQSNFGAKNEQLSGYYGQNKAWACIQLAITLFQSPNQLISKVYSTREGTSTCHCYPMIPVSVQRTPRFGRKWQILAVLCPNNVCVCVHTTVEAFQSLNWLMRNVCKAWKAIRTEVCHANPPLSVKMEPKLRNFGAKNKRLSGYCG